MQPYLTKKHYPLKVSTIVSGINRIPVCVYVMYVPTSSFKYPSTLYSTLYASRQQMQKESQSILCTQAYILLLVLTSVWVPLVPRKSRLTTCGNQTLPILAPSKQSYSSPHTRRYYWCILGFNLFTSLVPAFAFAIFVILPSCFYIRRYRSEILCQILCSKPFLSYYR